MFEAATGGTYKSLVAEAARGSALASMMENVTPFSREFQRMMASQFQEPSSIFYQLNEMKRSGALARLSEGLTGSLTLQSEALAGYQTAFEVLRRSETMIALQQQSESVGLMAKAMSASPLYAQIEELRRAQDNGIFQHLRELTRTMEGLRPLAVEMASQIDLDDDDIAALAEGAKEGRLTLSKLWQLIQYLLAAYTVVTIFLGHGYNPDDRARDQETAQQVAQNSDALAAMREDIECILAECIAAAETEYLASLPKAFVKSGANVRAEPLQSGERISRLGANVAVAIERKEGRWYYVKFIDPLASEMAEGWIWGGSLELMEN